MSGYYATLYPTNTTSTATTLHHGFVDWGALQQSAAAQSILCPAYVPKPVEKAKASDEVTWLKERVKEITDLAPSLG